VTTYSAGTIWLLIAAIGAGTFAVRFSLIALSGRSDRFPEAAQRALRFIPPAIFAALAAPAFLMPDDVIDISPNNLRLLAGIVASLIAWKTRSVLWTIVSGMASLWILQAIL
jgi:branched-subunit amino acid transport protein